MGAQALLTRLKSSLVRRTRIGNRAAQTAHSEKMARVRERLSRKDEKLEKLRRQVAAQDREILRLRRAVSNVGSVEQDVGLRPENMIWVFGTAKTGSTWFSSLLGDPPEYEEWREPYVGELFGSHYYPKMEGKYSTHKNKHWEQFWIMGGSREIWINAIRSFVLEIARAKFPGMTEKTYLVIKEPHGSHGAPLLMEAFPESRMIFLIRDPRDVAASALAARRKGSWLYERRHNQLGGEDTLGDIPPHKIVRQRAEMYLRDVSKTKEAYEAHAGYKVLVRYEDLRSDTLGELKRIYKALHIPMEEEALARTVEKFSFESIPQEKRGTGQSRRKATPGGWEKDLTPEQVEIVERITAPLLNEYYGDNSNLRLVE